MHGIIFLSVLYFYSFLTHIQSGTFIFGHRHNLASKIRILKGKALYFSGAVSDCFRTYSSMKEVACIPLFIDE